MNGRIYDPVLGQFMQPDNFIQTPEDYIGYDRYSYCRGNPFKFTDPSGEYWQVDANREAMINAELADAAYSLSYEAWKENATALCRSRLSRAAELYAQLGMGGSSGGPTDAQIAAIAAQPQANTGNGTGGNTTTTTDGDDGTLRITAVNKDGTKTVLGPGDHSSEGVLYYVVEHSTIVGHAFIYDPQTNWIYEVNAPEDEHLSSGEMLSLGLTSQGDEKSAVRIYDMTKADDRTAFWETGTRNKETSTFSFAPILLPDYQGSLSYLNSFTNNQSWFYILPFNNCKDYAETGIVKGGAPFWRHSSGPIPVIWHQDLRPFNLRGAVYWYNKNRKNKE